MMDRSLASLVTRERDDYFGRLFHNLGASRIREENGKIAIEINSPNMAVHLTHFKCLNATDVEDLPGQADRGLGRWFPEGDDILEVQAAALVHFPDLQPCSLAEVGHFGAKRLT